MAEAGLDHWADILVVVLYFVFVLAVGLWSVCRRNRESVMGYFLAGRMMHWFPVGCSLFSSNIGSEHFVGLAGTGAAAGIAMIMYEWSSMILVMCLGWLFLPVYISAGVYTLPEFMEKRFRSARIRTYLSCLSLVLYIVTKLAVSIYAGGLFIRLALGWNMYLAITVLLVITGLYTILGGLTAVIYTDTVQTVIMTGGAFALTGIGFYKIGGYSNLQRLYMEAVPSTHANDSVCGNPREDAFHLFRDPINSDNPWPGLVLQSTIGCLWYWCCDQVIVQRALAARNLSHAKAGSILAGYLKLLPLFLMIFPGMISRALYPDEIGCVDPDKCNEFCENPVGCSNIAYPKLVLELLPIGLRGLLMAVMLSAIMSSLTSIFNSSSTLMTMDIWRKIRPRAAERELLIVGRIFIVFLCAVSILWVPLVKSSHGAQLFNYIQAVQGYLGTPIGALFLWTILWKRMTEKGAFFGILIGHIAGIIRMAIDFANPSPDCGEADTRPDVLAKVHYSYFGSISLVVTSLAIVIISLATKAQPEEELKGLTWWTLYKESDCDDSAENNKENQFENAEKVKMMELETDKDNTDERGVCSRWLLGVVCGLPDKTDHEVEVIPIQERVSFLRQNPKWKNVINVNAAIGLSIMMFLVGYYR